MLSKKVGNRRANNSQRWGSLKILLVALMVGTMGASPTQVCQAQSRANSEDMKFPLTDLEEMRGEIVWMQGALLRANPAAYRNPVSPIAAYEQGLLAEDGQLWTFLDNPSGRELRYNTELRGHKVIIRGWPYPQSQIVDVYDWSDYNRHPVRTQEGYPMPERKPFDPMSAETIESIAPIDFEELSTDSTDQDLWMIREGTRLQNGQDRPRETTPNQQEANEILQRILENPVGNEATESTEDAASEDPWDVAPTPYRPTTPPAAPTTSRPEITAPPDPDQPRLTDPQEIDDLLRNDLLEEIVPQN